MKCARLMTDRLVPGVKLSRLLMPSLPYVWNATEMSVIESRGRVQIRHADNAIAAHFGNFR